MEAQSKMVDYAKHNSPIKSTTYYGSFTLCPSTGQNTSLTGTMTVQFYSNRVIKVDGEYYIPLDEEIKMAHMDILFRSGINYRMYVLYHFYMIIQK